MKTELMARLTGAGSGRPLYVPDLTLWYTTHTQRNSLPGPWQGQSLPEVSSYRRTDGQWEVHEVIAEAWSGYHKGVKTLKSAEQIIHHLVRYIVGVGNGPGNFTINVGPKGDGSIAAPQVKILREVGEWLCRNGESIYGAGSAPFFPLHLGGGATIKGNNAYIHVMFWPGKEMCIAGIKNKLLKAKFLATGEQLKFEQDKDRIFIRNLPSRAPDPIDTVIALKLDGEPKTTPETFWK